MIGHGGGPAGCAEVNRVVFFELFEAILGHHHAVFGVVVAAPVEFVEFEFDAEFAAYGFKRAQAFGHHFFADAVAGDDCDTKFFHDGFL